MSKKFGLLALVVFVATIFAANWTVQHYGIVPVGFGLMAPAAVFFVGLALTARDAIHESFGVRVVLGAILVAALLSALVAPTFALASGVAFGVSELCDLTIYAPLRKRSKTGGVLFSNLVGAAVDSLLFLWIAFHSLTFFWGQVVGKMEVTLATVLLLAAFQARSRLSRRPQTITELADRLTAAYGADPSLVGAVDGTEDDYGDLLCEAYVALSGRDVGEPDDDWQHFQSVAQSSRATTMIAWLYELRAAVAR